MTPIVEKNFFTVKLQRIQIQTLTDYCLRSILTNSFQSNRSSKQLGTVSLKPQIKAIQALQKSETFKRKEKKIFTSFSLVYVYIAIAHYTFTRLHSQCHHHAYG